MVQFHRRLAFRVLLPIVVFTMIFGAAIFGSVYYAMARFAQEQAENNLRWRSYAIKQIADSNENELQRLSRGSDPAAKRDRKINTLMAIEDFARGNGLSVIVVDQLTKRTTHIGDMQGLPPGFVLKEDEAMPLGKLDTLHSHNDRYHQHYVYAFRFEPWNWHITLIQNDRSYDTLLGDVQKGAVIAAIALSAGAALFMLYLTVIARGPINRIIRDLEEGREPSYTGIAEFEYLSSSITHMMRAIREHTAAIERYRDGLEQLVRERTTELTHANDELLKANRLLESTHQQLLQSEKLASIGQLAAGVAHEINNPVGFVNSNFSTLEDYMQRLMQMLDIYAQYESGIGAEARAVINKMKGEVELEYLKEDISQLLAESKEGLSRVKKIVQDLREFSHVGEAGWQYADVHRGLDSTLNIVRNELKYKSQVLKEYGDLPAIQCRPSELNQVFMNILVNAGHAIQQQGTITIRTGTDGEHVWVEISDTGCGIAPEHLSRIFDPFFTTKSIGMGTGLGLSLSYSIVKHHGGHIDVHSEVGKGTTFRISLPITQPEMVEF